MAISESQHNALIELLGVEHVSADATVLAQVAVQDVKPACLCVPGSAEQAAAIIRFAAENKLPVVPYGGGTQQGIGSPPPADFLALSTRRLTAGFQHEPADMVATVPAGMTLGALQEALGKNGQWLPLDGDPQYATLGGLIATDHSGPRALGYGTLRDMVLGMTVVNGDGVIRKCGGKVVKNVTGYALEKLYIGSLGTLGLVTEVTFKLRPLPIGRDQWTIPVDDIRAGLATLRAIGDRNLPLEVAQYYDAAAAFILNLEPHSKTIRSLVLVSATGTDAELDRIDRELTSAAAPVAAARAKCDPEATGQDLLLAVASGGGIPALPANDAASRYVGSLRFWCVPSKAQAAIAAIPFGDAISLNLRSGTVVVNSYERTENIDRVSSDLAGLGVNFRFENDWRDQVARPFGPPRNAEWALMKQIKAALDPQGIMNPGRYVTG